ncbi:5-oxoprolinase subunit PxpB [Sporosarcina aquimarina]|uniref:5-oxoprolinase subunit PxpB n=1 Tax=Sporosarcina aquimarina TaxID=114975 RepID=UPI001C8D3C07|nr:5-oxoprolinase subunit PxpB [Sporosarcina aquimarina]MBY0222469.1 5-oxoprolinase subunit PxpB [Sporosarcina aquimarina]
MKKETNNALIKPLGDSALIVQLGEGIDPSIHKLVGELTRLLEIHPFNGYIESVPAYTSLTVYYNPYIVHQSITDGLPKSPFRYVSVYMENLVQKIGKQPGSEEKLVTIPVVYGGEYGPDLEYVASHHGLSPDEVIEIHSKNEYLAYMIGFAPGFPFLGGMDERIATPRKETPRTSIPAGSVGIAGLQTGVYPLETPGGWQIIGRTPVDLFLPDQQPPTYLQAGYKIRFKSISVREYTRIKELKS